MEKIIDMKKEKAEVSQFATRIEMDAQLLALTNKITVCLDTVQQLTGEINALIETVNVNVQKQNDANCEFARLIQGNRHEIEAMKTDG